MTWEMVMGILSVIVIPSGIYVGKLGSDVAVLKATIPWIKEALVRIEEKLDEQRQRDIIVAHNLKSKERN